MLGTILTICVMVAYVPCFLVYQGIKLARGLVLRLIVRYGHQSLSDLLQIEIISDHVPRPQLHADGRLIVPVELRVELKEFRQFYHRRTGRRVTVAKIIYRQWRQFEHKIFKDNITSAVAVIGRDEVGQLWQHFPPPEPFIERSLEACQRYLLHADYLDDQIIDD